MMQRLVDRIKKRKNGQRKNVSDQENERKTGKTMRVKTSNIHERWRGQKRRKTGENWRKEKH